MPGGTVQTPRGKVRRRETSVSMLMDDPQGGPRTMRRAYRGAHYIVINLSIKSIIYG